MAKKRIQKESLRYEEHGPKGNSDFEGEDDIFGQSKFRSESREGYEDNYQYSRSNFGRSDSYGDRRQENDFGIRNRRRDNDRYVREPPFNMLLPPWRNERRDERPRKDFRGDDVESGNRDRHGTGMRSSQARGKYSKSDDRGPQRRSRYGSADASVDPDMPHLLITMPLTTKTRRSLASAADTVPDQEAHEVPDELIPASTDLEAVASVKPDRKGIPIDPGREIPPLRMRRVAINAIGGVPETFEPLLLDAEIVKILKKQGISEPTEIQAKVIARFVKYRENMIIGAETGSGKTLAYVLPIIQTALESPRTIPNKSPYAVVLVPNQLLVQQVSGVIASIGQNLRGIKVAPISHLQDVGACDHTILVSTPGALRSQVDKHSYEQVFQFTEILVVDEIDQLLQGSYSQDTKNIIDALKKGKKRALTKQSTSCMGPRGMETTRRFVFAGATINHSSVMWPIEHIKRKLLNVRIIEGAFMHRSPAALKEYFLPVTSSSCFDTLQSSIDACLNRRQEPLTETVKIPNEARKAVMHVDDDMVRRHPQLDRSELACPEVPLEFGIVFCDDIESTETTYKQLTSETSTNVSDIDWVLYHQDLPEEEGRAAMQKILDYQVARITKPLIVVSTDALSRGIDLPRTSHIFHYPIINDAMTYLHRVGRTCRNTRKGVSVALVRSEAGPMALSIDLCSRGIKIRHPYQTIQFGRPDLTISHENIVRYEASLDSSAAKVYGIQNKPASWLGRAPVWVEQWAPSHLENPKCDLTYLFSRNRGWTTKFHTTLKKNAEMNAKLQAIRADLEGDQAEEHALVDQVKEHARDQGEEHAQKEDQDKEYAQKEDISVDSSPSAPLAKSAAGNLAHS